MKRGGEFRRRYAYAGKVEVPLRKMDCSRSIEDSGWQVEMNWLKKAFGWVSEGGGVLGAS